MSRIFALASAVVLGAALAAPSSADDGKHWVATWATSPATFFVYTAPVPPVYPPGAPTTFAPANIQPDLVFPFPDAATTGATANDQTFRSIIKPDLWGGTMRFRFSNTFGSQPVTFSAVTVGLQEYSGNVVDGTMVRVTFGGSRSVTIPVGQEIWSDATKLPWVDGDDPNLQGRNLAVSYAIAGDSGPMTFHSGANQTSFITAAGSGDHTADLDVFAYEFTTASWFFIDAADVSPALRGEPGGEMPVDKKNGARPAITARRPVFLWLCLLVASPGLTAFPMRRSYRKIRLDRFASKLLPPANRGRPLSNSAMPSNRTDGTVSLEVFSERPVRGLRPTVELWSDCWRVLAIVLGKSRCRSARRWPKIIAALCIGRVFQQYS